MTSMDRPPGAARDADTSAASAGFSATGSAETDPLLYPRPGILAGARYRLVDRIGRGASAEVWRGWDERLSRPVAIKIFRDATEGDPAGRLRRSGEARLLASLSHQHLVAIYDAAGFGSEHEVSWMAMEFVNGRTLREVIAAGPLPAPAVAVIGRQLADALDYVHRRGAIHRDVKPANVLLANHSGEEGLGAEAEPFVKLTDFGVARLLDDTHLTLEGFTIGTANYLSPEQVTGDTCGPAVDVYALGLVLLEALTGKIAYPGVGAEAALIRLHRPPQIPEWLPAQWRSLLTAMTARVPAARPRLTAVRDALAALAADPPVGVETADGQASATDGAQSILDDLFPTDPVPLALPEDADVAADVSDRSEAGQWVRANRRESRPRLTRRAALLTAAAAAVVAAIATPLAFGGSASPSEAAAATAPAKPSPAGSENPARSRPSGRSARLVPAADIRDMRVTPARRHRTHVVAQLIEPNNRASASHGRHRTQVQHRGRQHHPSRKPAPHKAPVPRTPPPPRNAPGPYERPAPHLRHKPASPRPKPRAEHGLHPYAPRPPHDPKKPPLH